MHSVGLRSQTQMSMIFSTSSGGGKMAFSTVNTFPWMLDIRYSFRVQTTIDFSFCLQVVADEGSGVNLTSSEAFAIIATF